MEYFDVTNIPAGFLRARFRPASETDAQKLAALFEPVATALISKVSREQKLRIGASGPENSGKSNFLKSIIEKGFSTNLLKILLDGRVELYGLEDENILLLTDKKAHASLASRDTEDISEQHLADLIEERDILPQTTVHCVEWPEKDARNKNYNMLWKFHAEQISRTELKPGREIELFCTDEIAFMPEFEQFLDATEAEGLLLSRE